MIKLGVIGAGPNGTGNARNFAKYTERCRIAAISDPVLPAAETLAREFGAAVYENYEHMLDHVDAVLICSPNWLHPEQSIRCAAAGKHIWCEKPMALCSADAYRMVEAADAAKVKTMIGFSVRFSAVHQTMKQRASELGPLVSVWSRRTAWWPLEVMKGWRRDYPKSGGLMSEIMVHEIDWLVDLCGWPEAITARIASRYHNHPKDNEHVWITLNYPGQLTATAEGSCMSPMPDYYQGATGEKATFFTNKWGSELYLQPPTDKQPTRITELLPDFDKHAHFLDVIEERAQSVADFRYGAGITRLAELTLDSAIQKQTLPFTPIY
ncbi:MAG: Gfo/Idh/MocA family oxidoreductase [Verrucomicrobiota bacterium]|nr:Gfo/Idh/MocA family oxidoreductase [Verrucomicrobiota bacterium]